MSDRKPIPAYANGFEGGINATVATSVVALLVIYMPNAFPREAVPHLVFLLTFVLGFGFSWATSTARNRRAKTIQSEEQFRHEMKPPSTAEGETP